MPKEHDVWDKQKRLPGLGKKNHRQEKRTLKGASQKDWGHLAGYLKLKGNFLKKEWGRHPTLEKPSEKAKGGGGNRTKRKYNC